MVHCSSAPTQTKRSKTIQNPTATLLIPIPPNSDSSLPSRFSPMADTGDDEVEIPGNVRLMYMANEGDVDGIRELLEKELGTIDVNYSDVHGRTALHVAACQGFDDVVELLVRNGGRVDPKDGRGNTPLGNAIHYKNDKVIKLLEKYGAKYQMVPMLVKSVHEVPEYEINSKELDFTNSSLISKGTFRIASWRGIQVAVKTLGDEVFSDQEKIRAFRDELALLQKMRHPNVVQFLGAVTQSSPMMIVTEYLPQGDLRELLKRNGAFNPSRAVQYALDIARGMNYLHQHKPDAIIHRDLEPSNILLDDSWNLKVADFDVSKSLLVAETVREEKPPSIQDISCRYVAPAVFQNFEYDTKVDVFSFALILQEMIEGRPPFHGKQENEVPKLFAAGQRPPFIAPQNLYSCGLKRLIEDCWHVIPSRRPTFQQIIDRLFTIQNRLQRKNRLETLPSKCFPCLFTIWDEESSNSSKCSSSSSR